MLTATNASVCDKDCFQKFSIFHEILNGSKYMMCYLDFIGAKEPGENNNQSVFSAPLNFLQGC